MLEDPRAHRRGSVRERIEAMTTRGSPIGQIVAEVGCSYAYAEQVIRIFRAYRSREEAARHDPERDQAHVDACLARGGFPYATVMLGKTFWFGPNGGLWRAA